ncbi:MULTISPECIES: GntR family transcriptional regulator [unclassified Achromobacter]|uniref:GntR family transcriptional regulator n=1 Tax=unclassified Achromobacter TaxID=2626865 RepID=UPI000B51548F|nr:MULTISPECIES: GntR family transcriptional regulator [unclassified Achromobacter]OWT67949.1 GntR family transcriptional regulator [Achromobacter sp. HZ28]OWT81007.1 GntR family transcriptional regulator [Achromobacter sp. HZ34]
MSTHPKAIPHSPIPRYVAVADQLRKRIANGEWPAGHCLPSLQQLAEAFGVARLTARQAVQLLVAEGRLSSHRGQGTYVTEDAPPIRTAPLASSLRELGDTYRDLEPIILAIDENPRPLPLAETGLDEGYVYMRRLHMHEGRPYCLISLYVAQSVFALCPQRFKDRAVVLVLLEQPEVDIARAHQTLTIGTADAETASFLRISKDAPTAEVRRVFRRPDGEVLYYAEVTYRGDAIRLEIDLKP